jgi:hypothetical protein
MDGTAIKTIARSNPFVLILENGKTDKLPKGLSKNPMEQNLNTNLIITL